MGKAQYVPLAHVFNKRKHSIAGKLASEKLDGQRGVWDGGASRGLPKSEVPYANCDRDERYKKPPIATGLWSRYGNVIHAPDWFLDRLPKLPLDIELYAGRKNFQFVQSTIKDIVPGPGWQKIVAMVLDSPPMDKFLSPRTINERNIKLTIYPSTIDWWQERAQGIVSLAANAPFEGRLAICKKAVKECANLRIHQQLELPFSTKEAELMLSQMMSDIVGGGGEGVIVKSRHAQYICERTYDTLKVKPKQDAEGIVIGYNWGKLPDNTRSSSGEAEGKYVGVMGSLIVKWEGKEFKVSGFTDEERRMIFTDSGLCAADEGILHPGEPIRFGIHNPTFPRFSTITFEYRELSDDGIPKEAHFFRKRDER